MQPKRFIRDYTLLYAFIRFYTLLYAFIRFYTLFLRFLFYKVPRQNVEKGITFYFFVPLQQNGILQ